jgi:hypothetical protein
MVKHIGNDPFANKIEGNYGRNQGNFQEKFLMQHNKTWKMESGKNKIK